MINYGNPLLEARFWAKVEIVGECWLWTGAKDRDGYPQFGIRVPVGRKFRTRTAHRVAYEALVAVVPAGLTLDHTCRVRHCVRPNHLDPVPIGVNTLRGDTVPAAHARKTHCPSGHAYDEANTYWWNNRRACRACKRLRQRKAA